MTFADEELLVVLMENEYLDPYGQTIEELIGYLHVTPLQLEWLKQESLKVESLMRQGKYCRRALISDIPDLPSGDMEGPMIDGLHIALLTFAEMRVQGTFKAVELVTEKDLAAFRARDIFRMKLWDIGSYALNLIDGDDQPETDAEIELMVNYKILKANDQAEWIQKEVERTILSDEIAGDRILSETKEGVVKKVRKQFWFCLLREVDQTLVSERIWNFEPFTITFKFRDNGGDAEIKIEGRKFSSREDYFVFIGFCILREFDVNVVRNSVLTDWVAILTAWLIPESEIQLLSDLDKIETEQNELHDSNEFWFLSVLEFINFETLDERKKLLSLLIEELTIK